MFGKDDGKSSRDVVTPTAAALKSLNISGPYNPVHLHHVGYNPETGEFTGLPPDWQALLMQFTKQEQQSHPQTVLDIIGFYQDAQKEAQSNKTASPWTKFQYGQTSTGSPAAPKVSLATATGTTVSGSASGSASPSAGSSPTPHRPAPPAPKKGPKDPVRFYLIF
ncbi:hypothetical protein BC828DRAFT_350462 [Blastocladiella britannica]|nr:hypothetical protein BC828DRAFT_350462 [Blastocladiella britannica]